jgi:thioredoxin reductase/bacterioferritin-associated ferredoxin
MSRVPGSAEVSRVDVIVIGAGPAGAEAAIGAAEGGLAVTLLDEQGAAGGQVWRAPVGGFPGKGDPEAAAGRALRARLQASPVQAVFEHRVWSVVRDHSQDGLTPGFRVDAVGPHGNLSLWAPFLVVATGAHERVVPFPGWTLPGVFGLAAATILLKSHGLAPGRRVVVAGCGPLLLAVTAGLVHAGVEVLSVADLSRRVDWLARTPAVLGRPELALRGAGWWARAALSGARILSAHGVRRAEGREGLERVVLGPVDAGGRARPGSETAFEADALVVGHGLTTACEVTRMLRARHQFSRLYGGWIPSVDSHFETTVPGLFAVGDGAGIRGQQIATLAGRQVALALQARAGRNSGPGGRGDAGGDGASRQGGRAHAGGDRTSDSASDFASVDRQLDRARPFSDAMSGLMALRSGQVADIAPDTIVCRCEDVTRAEIDAAIDQSAGSIDQLKHFTRCGMGPCQGRYCGDTVQELMALRLQEPREVVGQWTGRPPLRPVSLGELVGEFNYDDIPIPKPAPL